MLKSRHANLKGSRPGPFSLGVTLNAPQESQGAGLSNSTGSAWGLGVSRESPVWRKGMRCKIGERLPSMMVQVQKHGTSWGLEGEL